MLAAVPVEVVLYCSMPAASTFSVTPVAVFSTNSSENTTLVGVDSTLNVPLRFAVPLVIA